MQKDEGDARLVQPATERSIFRAFRVANALGHGFVEKAYRNAPDHEIRTSGLGIVQQRRIMVPYDDLIVAEQVIVELKMVGALSDGHVPQWRNDVRAAGEPLCPRINFGRPEVEIRRVTLSFACSVPSQACALAQAWSREPSPSSPLIPLHPP